MTVPEPPPELLLYINCEKFQCLPEFGGWYEQSPEICFAFSLITSIINEEEGKKASAVSKANKRKR